MKEPSSGQEWKGELHDNGRCVPRSGCGHPCRVLDVPKEGKGAGERKKIFSGSAMAASGCAATWERAIKITFAPCLSKVRPQVCSVGLKYLLPGMKTAGD